MNVLLVVPWDHASGGVASVVANLAKHLGKSGHGVCFLHPGPNDRLRERRTILGSRGYELNLRDPMISEKPIKSAVAFFVYLAHTLHQLARIVRAEKIDLVNIHYPVESFAVLGVLRLLSRIRLVVSIHGADLAPDGIPRARQKRSIRFLLWAADAIVAPSRSFLGECEPSLRSSPRKAGWIHNGIDPEELTRPVGERSDESHGAYLLCIAASNRKKALDVLLRAFVLIAKREPALSLVIVGDGPLRAELESLARTLGVGERVRFLGWRGRDEVGRLLRGCELFVLPSRAEPFGIVVAEAMACQKAVVASAVGGIPEILEDGRSGVLVEPDDVEALADAVLAVLHDPARRESLAAAGYARVMGKFTMEMTGARYERLFGSLLAGQSAEEVLQ